MFSKLERIELEKVNKRFSFDNKFLYIFLLLIAVILWYVVMDRVFLMFGE